MSNSSERADVFLVSHGFAASRSEAQAAINAGRVEADGQIVTKPAQKLSSGMTIQYEAAHPYVSRGGIKLAAALDHFALSPEGRIGLCLEQPAGHLLSFLEAYEWITLYPINPITLKKYREAFVTSRAKDDGQDAQYLAELLWQHADQLQAWAPEDSPTRTVRQLVFHRRAVVDERTALSNRLKSLLKQYFPQALSLCGEDLWRPLATAFLLKWPSLHALQKAQPARVKQFYYWHGSRSVKLIEAKVGAD